MLNMFGVQQLGCGNRRWVFVCVGGGLHMSRRQAVSDEYIDFVKHQFNLQGSPFPLNACGEIMKARSPKPPPVGRWNCMFLIQIWLKDGASAGLRDRSWSGVVVFAMGAMELPPEVPIALRSCIICHQGKRLSSPLPNTSPSSLACRDTLVPPGGLMQNPRISISVDCVGGMCSMTTQDPPWPVQNSISRKSVAIGLALPPLSKLAQDGSFHTRGAGCRPLGWDLRVQAPGNSITVA